MSNPLNRAQHALDSRQKNVNPRYKPEYHLSVPAGWLNDPNGFGFYQGKCHLFYQLHPYDSVWGLMHWGHWSSEDMVHWRHEPVAMAPDRAFDALGCFSGTALEVDGRYYLAYTGVSEGHNGGPWLQQQCLAWTQDGIHIEKLENNPIVPCDMLPEGAAHDDFRDPKLEKTDSGYRMIAASRGKKGGQLLSFVSGDLLHWQYDGVYLDGLCEMAECPDCFELDGHRVVAVSLMGCKDERLVTPQPVVYMIGHEENGAFHPYTPMRDVDRGLDFYAPQTCETPDGRRILIGWAFSCGRTIPTHTLGHGWVGTMTLPRECRIEDGRLYQRPVRELESRRQNGKTAGPIEIGEKVCLSECSGPCREIVMDVDMSGAESFALHLMETDGEHLKLTYDKATEMLTLDRRLCGHPFAKDGKPEENTSASASAPLRNQLLSLRIFVDVSIIEVYVNDGESVLTIQAFPKENAYGVSACAQGLARIARLRSYEIR